MQGVCAAIRLQNGLDSIQSHNTSMNLYTFADATEHWSLLAACRSSATLPDDRGRFQAE
jgi:hypothetical protein